MKMNGTENTKPARHDEDLVLTIASNMEHNRLKGVALTPEQTAYALILPNPTQSEIAAIWELI